MRQHLILSVLAVSSMAAPCSPAQNAGLPAQPDVTLNQPNPSTYVVSNGIVTATFDGPQATVSSIVYKGENMVSQQGRHNRIYWSMDGGKTYQNPNHAVCTLKSNTAEMVDLGCKHTYEPSDPHAVDIDIHYVLRRGKPGLYVYAILSHPASYPATGIGEWRIVWPTNEKNGNYVLDKIYVDEKRHWTMPTLADQAAAQTMGIKEISLFKTGAWAGRMESKYTYSATYEDIGAFGFASDSRQLGAWTVLGNYEYYNDGPRKQDLTALQGAMTHHFGRNHYGGTGLEIRSGEAWSKIFGPFLLYFNSGAPGDALWHDARAQADREHALWPYDWLTGVPEYPSRAERGTLTGTLRITDSLRLTQTAAGAWVGLTQPAPGLDFQSEAKNYQYWVKAAPDGSFTIPAVRPGTYTLYAFVNGEVGQYSAENIPITAGRTTAAGTVTWHIPRTGTHFAWEIGTPDRDSTEFRHGDDFFTPYLYTTFNREFPNPLVFTVGVSDPAKDWNYAQSSYPGFGRPVPWTWTVRFNLADVPKQGAAALIVALAGSNTAHLAININGKKIADYTPPLDGGNALLRQGSHAKYSTSTFPIPLSKLHKGENAIDFTQSGTRDNSAIFWDYLALEMPGPK